MTGDVEEGTEPSMTAREILAALRTAYPDWGFLHDQRTSTWMACKGRHVVITHTNPIALRCAVESAQ